LVGTQRFDLIQAADLILWDEFWSNHRQLYESAINFINENTTIVAMGDPRQILPITKGGHRSTIEATFTSSPHWTRFRQFTLTKNMRLLSIFSNLGPDSSDIDRQRYETELEYAQLIQAIGEGESKGTILIYYI
jgi:hypothetical protein